MWIVCYLSFFFLTSVFPAISLGFTILLLLHSQLYLWGSPFFFFSYIPSYISGVHHSSSSSAFPAISLGFTILLLLRSQLYLWGSPFFFFFCVPSCISGVHHSLSSVFPAVYVGFTVLVEIFAYVTVFFNPTIVSIPVSIYTGLLFDNINVCMDMNCRY